MWQLTNFSIRFASPGDLSKKKVAYIAGGKIRTKQEEVSSVNMKNTASRQAESGITVLYPFLCGRRAV
ncbi:hypothetical protein DW757_17140 [Clostridium sp. AM29-11AC]|nr:hypothetical protein DW757_17140 [Clostridium sp. AM29-11AC]